MKATKFREKHEETGEKPEASDTLRAAADAVILMPPVSAATEPAPTDPFNEEGSVDPTLFESPEPWPSGDRAARGGEADAATDGEEGDDDDVTTVR